LITGGIIESTSDWPVVARPELYDPATGTFSVTGDYADRNTGSMYGTWGLVGVPAVLLPNGTVLVAGEPTAELYDPATQTFSLTDKMTANTFLGGPTDPIYINGRTATLLQDEKILLVGGENEDLGEFIAELYDPSAGRFTTLGLTHDRRAWLWPHGDASSRRNSANRGRPGTGKYYEHRSLRSGHPFIHQNS
jgi:hypothetical protein